MTDNVFIFGAGFSHDSGIPLMSGFVERMWDLSIRERINDVKLHETDIALFRKAIQVKNKLDSYHGRATFDDRNIEDILSILSLNALGGGAGEKNSLTLITNAIARTIELTCTVKHPGIDPQRGRVVQEGPEIYRKFWLALLRRLSDQHPIPTILTFNYDLVLERSLLQVLVGTTFDGKTRLIPSKDFGINYYHDSFDGIRLRINNVQYPDRTAPFERAYGTNAELDNRPAQQAQTKVDILKLHGSLNFKRKKDGTEENGQFTLPVQDPYILPPVSSKMSFSKGDRVWREALQKLRSAKNVTIVGYSLPKTDIYMQYFLKAALGPNVNLNRITVFDPTLFMENSDSEAMKERYASCFAPQLQKRIIFQPSLNKADNILQGSLTHFVRNLESNDSGILF